LSPAGGRHCGDEGLGGFICCATPVIREAVATLRARKHRPAKPLAVMLPTAAGLGTGAGAADSPAAPIVLMEKAQVAGLCDEIAPGLAEVG
jgi:hydrogenase maturation protein HypF